MSLPVTFSSLLDTPPLETTAARSLSRRAVLVPLAIVTTLLIGWASLAPISGAVIAAARIKVELERKTVQHREGGIVREIRVRNGQKVRAGDVLVVVDDVRSDAELSLLEDQLLRRARAPRARPRRDHARAGTSISTRSSPPSRAPVSTWRASANNSPLAAGRSMNR